ncbi:MAG: hypothetical protein CVV42_05120 [Candidatus Riflebacteria bacterium HGW-Riflebacteria-2]|jgi:hypothetical protein|nr:MAG: hypothetical protein CVV42_05120 [Candidatus Riflebacteria bacterium HGW-Riflebacteria-2]
MRIVSALLLTAAILISCNAFATEGDLKYLGFSQEVIDEAVSISGMTPVKQAQPAAETDEETLVQEQLYELGRTRSLSASLQDRSEVIRDEVLSYWEQMSPDATQAEPLSDELKASLTANIRAGLESNGYRISQLDLLDLPEGSLHNKLRVVVRVAKELRTRNSYQEIQGNLAEVRQICTAAATIDGYNYLSELTTFVAENPKNNYYYEKTILKP